MRWINKMRIDIYKESLKLYNPEAKSHFLESVDLEESSKRNMFYTLKRADKFLKQFNKDIYNLTAEEIEDIMYSCGFKTKTSARVFYYNLMAYVTWAEAEGYITGYLPKFTESSGDFFDKYVSKTLSNYYTQDDLLEIYDTLTNPQDTLILQCVFEGIRGKSNSEIINLKIKDVYEGNDDEGNDAYFVNLYDTEKGTERLGHEISKYLYELMEFVNGLPEIEDGRGVKMEFLSSKYILKRTFRGKHAEQTEGMPINNSFIMNRMFSLKTLLEDNNFRIKDIEKSGVMHYLNELLEHDDPAAKTISRENYIKIADKFNIGKYIHSYTGDECINHLAIKNMIDEDWFNKQYGKNISI